MASGARLSEAQVRTLEAFDRCDGGEHMSEYQRGVLKVTVKALESLVPDGYVKRLSTSALWKLMAAGRAALSAHRASTPEPRS